MKIKITWAHGVVFLLGGFILFIMTLILAAGDTGELVTEDYYEKSLVYQEQELDAQKRAQALPFQPQVKKQANGFTIEFPKDYTFESGEVFLFRASDKTKDVLLPLQLDPVNSFLIPAVRLVSGEYDLRLSWQKQGKPYVIKKTLQWSKP